MAMTQKFGQGATTFAERPAYPTVPHYMSSYPNTFRWQATATATAEKRQCIRRDIACELMLIDDAMEEQTDDPVVVPAECLNISDDGLYGIVPIGYGVAMGQRYTFRLTIGERGPEPGSLQIVSQQGIIVRTELLIGEDGSGDRVGAGVRLCGHRCGMVPMPMSA